MISKLTSNYQLPLRWHFLDFEVLRLYSYVQESIVTVSLKHASYFAAAADL